jgi:hypothetical protein
MKNLLITLAFPEMTASTAYRLIYETIVNK